MPLVLFASLALTPTAAARASSRRSDYLPFSEMTPALCEGLLFSPDSRNVLWHAMFCSRKRFVGAPLLYPEGIPEMKKLNIDPHNKSVHMNIEIK